jgi:hypothetical protein
MMTVPLSASGRGRPLGGADDPAVGRLVRRRPRRHPGWGRLRPLLIVLDCKGGPDARAKANRTRRLLHGTGARRVAIWPDEARLSLWDLPAADLAVLLFHMIESGDGAAAYYSDIMQAMLTLAVTAPGVPPLNAAGSWTGRTPAG